MTAIAGRVVLQNVRYSDVPELKALGARWCYTERHWHISDGMDPGPFIRAGFLNGVPAPAPVTVSPPLRRALRVHRQDGHPYTLALGAVFDWHAADDPRLSFIDLSSGARILVQGTEAMVAEAFAAAAVCPWPR